MAKSAKLQVFGAKTESTQNTAASLSATDYCLVDSATVNPVPEFLKREYKHATLGALASIMGKLYVEVAVKVAIKGGANATTPYAPHGALLQAAGLIQTISSGTVYSFASSAISNFAGFCKSCTIEVYEAGPSPVKHQVKGCIAKSAKLTAKAGGFLMLEATYQGLYVAPTDASFPAVTLAETIKEPVLASSSLSTHSYSGIVSSIEIDFGLETVLREDSASAYGVGGFACLGRRVIGSLDPEAVNVATHDVFGLMLARTAAALTFNVNGAATGNKFAFSLPKIQYDDVAWAERGLIKTFKLPFTATENTGDDELTITVS